MRFWYLSHMRKFILYSACWVIFHAFVVVCWLFSKLTFSKNSFKDTIRMSNSLDPDQDWHFVGPDLGSNCLQRFISRRKQLPLYSVAGVLIFGTSLYLLSYFVYARREGTCETAWMYRLVWVVPAGLYINYQNLILADLHQYHIQRNYHTCANNNCTPQIFNTVPFWLLWGVNGKLNFGFHSCMIFVSHTPPKIRSVSIWKFYLRKA